MPLDKRLPVNVFTERGGGRFPQTSLERPERCQPLPADSRSRARRRRAAGRVRVPDRSGPARVRGAARPAWRRCITDIFWRDAGAADLRRAVCHRCKCLARRGPQGLELGRETSRRPQCFDRRGGAVDDAENSRDGQPPASGRARSRRRHRPLVHDGQPLGHRPAASQPSPRRF